VAAFADAMTLRLYNTRTRRKDPFAPLVPGVVKMYVCGPTTYDYSHLGHARSYIAFDIARRYLEFLGNRVTYVQNFTDIEEVIIRRAAAAGKPPLEFAQFFIDAFLEDMRALNVRPAVHYPKVTQHIPEIIRLVERLIDRGYAYAIDGEVYFRTKRAEHSFGILSHRKVEDIVVDAVPVGSRKEDPLDFALWKTSKEGEPSWPSPWGQGRPGWHVECNAMAFKYLGAPLDIHGGGVDLMFPHHESEAMICEGAWGQEWARTWMHNGFLTLEREKMSKSLGNFVTIREVLRDYPGEVVRLCLLKAHYRQSVEYDADCFPRAREEWDAMRSAIAAARAAKGLGTGGKVDALVDRTRNAFRKAMDDDLNTTDAVFRLRQMTEALGELPDLSADEGRSISNVYRECGQVLGLFADLE
jgi:cysteinyl-tRNA synthetase